MAYILYDRKGQRSEFAKAENAKQRLIHAVTLTTRKVGTCTEPVIRNKFAVIIPEVRNEKEVADGKCELTTVTSISVELSSRNRAEAQKAWDELKKQVDGAFASQEQVFMGLPINPTSIIN